MAHIAQCWSVLCLQLADTIWSEVTHDTLQQTAWLLAFWLHHVAGFHHTAGSRLFISGHQGQISTVRTDNNCVLGEPHGW